MRRRTKPLPPRSTYLRHLGRGAAITAGLLGACLGIGVAGYHFIEGLPWVDALLNASMILSGMGPVNPLKTTPGKLFASFYALLSGVAFISTMGLLLAAPLHRLLHRFHIELDDDAQPTATGSSQKPRSQPKATDPNDAP